MILNSQRQRKFIALFSKKNTIFHTKNIRFDLTRKPCSFTSSRIVITCFYSMNYNSISFKFRIFKHSYLKKKRINRINTKIAIFEKRDFLFCSKHIEDRSVITFLCICIFLFLSIWRIDERNHKNLYIESRDASERTLQGHHYRSLVELGGEYVCLRLILFVKYHYKNNILRFTPKKVH